MIETATAMMLANAPGAILGASLVHVAVLAGQRLLKWRESRVRPCATASSPGRVLESALARFESMPIGVLDADEHGRATGTRSNDGPFEAETATISGDSEGPERVQPAGAAADQRVQADFDSIAADGDFADDDTSGGAGVEFWAARERAFVRGLHAQTGRTLKCWMDAIERTGPVGRNPIIEWLRNFGFSYSEASWLERIAHNGGRLLYDDRETRSPSHSGVAGGAIDLAAADHLGRFLIWVRDNLLGRHPSTGRIEAKLGERAWVSRYLRWARTNNVAPLPESLFLSLLGKADGVEKTRDRIKGANGRVLKTAGGSPVRRIHYTVRLVKPAKRAPVGLHAAEDDRSPLATWAEDLASMPIAERRAYDLAA